MMLTFGRKYVIDAIAGANCYHSEQRLRKLFPAGKNILDRDTAYSILGNYSKGSSKWFERARLISNTDGGPPLEEILNEFNVDEDNIICDFREGLNSRSSFDDVEYNDNIPNRVSPETVVDRAIVIAPKPRYACVGVTESSINADAENTMNIVAATTTNADHISRDNVERNMNIVAAATTNADHISRDNAERTMNIVADASSNHSLTLADANHCMNIVAAATYASHIYPSIAANASHIYHSIAANASKMYPSSDANQHMNIVAAAATTNASHIYPSTDANHRMSAPQPIDEDSMSVTDQDDPVHRK